MYHSRDIKIQWRFGGIILEIRASSVLETLGDGFGETFGGDVAELVDMLAIHTLLPTLAPYSLDDT